MSIQYTSNPDVVLVGAGIMSATLAVLLKELNPALTIEIFEGLNAISTESSNAWNNAGTGHAALCELNYTPEKPDGSIPIDKAVEINEAFEISKQFWAYLARKGALPDIPAFLNQVPHLSFVHGEKNVAYLKKRHAALSKHPFFAEMKYSEDPKQLAEWMPVMMDGRSSKEPIAATRVEIGADVNFGTLTRMLIAYLQKQDGVFLHLRHRITDLKRRRNGEWTVVAQDRMKRTRTMSAKFIFLGAGGGALPLLQKSGIREGKGYGGFPVSGQFLQCTNPEIVEKHHAKVYGKASVGAPPMSVPHLDTRVIEGKKSLLFGPYAGFSTKFLKGGSLLDMPLSIKLDNVLPMLAAGKDNIDLTKYLIAQVLQSPKDRLEALKEFVPNANGKDWKLTVAGQRVQIIKKVPKKGGVLQFGTEVICAADGSIAALLGASPGASTAVSIMLDLANKSFKSLMKSPAGKAKLKEMIPSYGESLAKNEALYHEIRNASNEALGFKAGK